MDVLRFITAGSIDDGKSTLIGRLLLDTGNIKSDILESVKEDNDDVNLAFITDGLRAERQAGITIDVAYKYFTTPNRKFIITDAPGHFQYTKNLVTGASGVDAMIILIDATIGISSQTRRHSMVASFLGIRNIVVAINKMDVSGYDQSVYNSIKNSYSEIAIRLNLDQVTYIPISALKGDNVTRHSYHMPWYTGPALLQFLEACKPEIKADDGRLSVTVQYVAGNNIFGRLVSGTIKRGQNVVVYPGRITSIVKEIINNYIIVEEAFTGHDICVQLELQGTLMRGATITGIGEGPEYSNEFEADLCWLDELSEVVLNRDYILRIGANEVVSQVKEIISKRYIETLGYSNDQKSVSVNEFARVIIHTSSNIAYDNYSQVHETGRGILIDITTNNTSGALIIR